MADWKSYTFEVDLVEAAQFQIKFLKRVDDIGDFQTGEKLKRAIYRYEKIWLPLYSKWNENTPLIPPIDVAWVWHVHMLAPIFYLKDTVSNYGSLLDHKMRDQEEEDELALNSKLVWEKESNSPYDYTKDETDTENFKSQLSYDIESASSRQKKFYYNVSLPHFKTREFLEIGLERYKKFLFLKKTYPQQFVVPCYVIDIIWHTHQLHPRFYKRETVSILGKIFPHDDNVTDRSTGSKLDVAFKETKELWKKLYGEDFNIAGALHRGEFNREAYSESTLDVEDVGKVCGKYCLKEVKLLDESYGDSKKPELEVMFCIYKISEYGHSKMVHNGFISSNKVASSNKEFYYQQNELSNDSIEFVVFIEQRIKNNYFQIPAIKVFKAIDVNKLSEKQEWRIKMYDCRDNKKFYLSLTWMVSDSDSKLLDMGILGGPFKKQDFKAIKDNLQPYDLGHIVYDIDKIKLTSATHKIVIPSANDYFLANIWHLHNPCMGGLQVLNSENEIVVTARTMGFEQLPSEKLNETFITFNPNEECAMIVKNFKGDFSILKAKWMKEKGYMGIEYYEGFDKKPQFIKYIESIPFMVSNKTGTISANVDHSIGKIIFEIKDVNFDNSNAEIESMLASILSMTILWYYLKPKHF